MSRANTLAAGSSAIDSTVLQSPSKAGSTQSPTSPTSPAASSQSSQSSRASPSPSSSSTSVSTTTDSPPSDESDSATNSPLTSSTPSKALRPSSAPNVPATPSVTVFTTTTSALPSQALTPSQSQSSRQASTGGASFFHNKTAMIAVFASVGVFVLVVILIFVIVVLRWKRRKDLIESAMDFSPTTEHLFNGDNYSGGGSNGGSAGALISRSSGSLSSDTRDTRPRVPSVTLGPSPFMSVPALAPAPVSVPATVYSPGEMQQRGPGTGYLIDRWLDREVTSGAGNAYGNSAQPYYDTVRQQQPPPPPPLRQRQQLQYQRQPPPPPPLRWQKQEERPLPPDLPTDVGPIPSSLMPSSQHDTAVFNVPFATTATKPLRLGTDGGRGGGGGPNRTLGSLTGKMERRQTQQVPLPPPRRFSRNIPDTLGRNDEGSGDINVRVDEDRRNRPRVLKVVNE